ncbi:MAG: S-layer homology domain-containing protein [Oscillospiraceae bacterium]|nr:S-layer homology domain-containing protein [Oscillospiraceae bacterium]
MKKRILSMVLALTLVLGCLGGLTVRAADTNLAVGRPATASSVANGCGPEIAVDGITDQSSQWNSENMKNGTVADDAPQNEQWLQVDLGTSGARISQIKLWYNLKVWPMVYRIETTDTPDDPGSWQTVVSVSRPSRNGWVWNGAGQDIADETANTDTITLTSSPSLEMTELGRYVRFYVEKVNAQAPGNNVNLREIEIFGTLPGGTQPSYTVRGSELENVIANDGTPSRWNIGDRDVTLLVTENGVEKNVVVTAWGQSASYPREWFPEVDHPNPKPQVIPTIQEWYGYEGNFTLTADSRIVINDAALVGLNKVAAVMQENIRQITGFDPAVVEGTSGDADDIYIESLTDPELYDLGDEGYLMVTNGEGIRIFAPTYTGCMFGAVTVEQMLWMAADHRSVPMGIMRDYPAYEVRGLKLDIARTPYRYQQLVDYAKIMRWYKMNEYDLHINDNDNANIQGATWESHAGFHRLESETFPSLKSETKHVGFPQSALNADYYNNNADYQGNPTYTKEQWRSLAQLTEDLGMYLVTEIDLPAHSLLYNKYAMENPDSIDWLTGGIHYTGNDLPNSNGEIELMDLTGPNAQRALQFSRALWDEYTRGDEPTIYGDIVHIGADEYWVHNTATHNGFATFADEMRKVIQGNLGADTKIRMWGAGASSFATAPAVLGMTHAELAEHYQLDIWATAYDNPAQRAKEGYQIVNCRDAYLYGNPGRTRRDVPNAEYLFNDWNPTIFGGNNPKLGEPNLLGAKAVIWGDQSQEGMTERDIHQRVLQSIAIVSEKTWNGTDADDTFAQWEIRFGHLAEGPGTEIAMQVDSASSLVLKYDFDHISADGRTVYDRSGNGYDAAVTGGSFADGWMTFDGESLLETPLKTLSYPYTVSFDIRLSEANSKEASLFSGYDGRIQVAGYQGRLSADVNYFTRDFGYTVPTDGTEATVTIVGTLHGTKVYVNGELVTFLSQKQDQDGLSGVTSLYSSVLLPLEKIGQDFRGSLSSITVYNKALSAEEVQAVFDGIDDGKVNVAQNTYAGGDSYRPGDAQDDAEQRTRTAAKAIDGDGFAIQANPATQPDTATSDIYSYWRGDHADSSLTVDLGVEREISEIGIQWRYGGKGRDLDILTSLDGEIWTTAKAVRGNGDFFQTIRLDSPVSARYVKMQGIASNASVYMIQEFMAYETVSKTALANAVAEAADLLDAEDRALVFAQAMLDNPLATKMEVATALDTLTEAMEQAAPKLSFTDVPVDSFYYDPVLWAVKKGITTGATATTFNPNGQCQRAQVVAFLWRAAGSPEPVSTVNPFTDVKESDFYYKAVLWAVEQKITNGLTATTFGPFALCNRAQVVTFLWRAMGSPDSTAAVSFADVKAGQFYSTAVAWAVEKGITNGISATEFGVGGICNRAQVVTFLYRAFVNP